MSGIDPAALFYPLLGSTGVMLAVSGGKDSTALMVLAARWRDGLDEAVPVCVATVDHGLRPEAGAETELVAGNASRLGLDCVVLKAAMAEPGTGPASGNLQARARRARYQCLAQAARVNGCDTIVTAHHLEDQAETFLIRLARGSGVYGLGAVRERSRCEGLALFRPLLNVERSGLCRIVAESGLSTVDDPSNRDMGFARIRWRSMMPGLEQAGLTADRISQTAKRLQRAADALDHYASELLAQRCVADQFGAIKFDADSWANLPDETVLRALARLLQAVGGSEYTPRLDRLEPLLGAIRTEMEGAGGLRRTLNGCVVDLEMGQLCVYREWGRAGPAHETARPGRRMTWDRRFSLDLPADLPETIVVAPLGDSSRDLRRDAPLPVLRTIPALFAGETLFAVPQFATAAAGTRLPVFACHSLIKDRLLNPAANHGNTPWE